MLSIINKFQSHKYYKHFLTLTFCCFVFLTYSAYVWYNTVSSDNAFVDSDISNISSQISGTVQKIYVSENSKVKTGDLIAQIDDTIHKANFEKAKNKVDIADNDIQLIERDIILQQTNLHKVSEVLELSKTNLEIVQRDYNRIHELSKDNFTSKKLLDNAKAELAKVQSSYNQAVFDLKNANTNLELLNIKLKNAKADLYVAQNELKIAQFNYEQTKIFAPVDGTISNISLKLGVMVQPGMLIFSIVPEKMYVRVNFKETQMQGLRVGMQASIKVDALSSKTLDGVIHSISPATGAKFSLFPPDNATGNFTKIVQRVPVLIYFKETDTAKAGSFDTNIVSGMSAKVFIRVDQ